MGAESTYQMASSLFEGKNGMKTLKSIIKRCEVCQKNNPKTEKLANLDYNEVESILETTGKVILLIWQMLMGILAYKFG